MWDEREGEKETGDVGGKRKWRREDEFGEW